MRSSFLLSTIRPEEMRMKVEYVGASVRLGAAD